MCSAALCLQSSGSNKGKNMDTPSQDCTIEEQRGVVRFIWAEGVKPLEIHHQVEYVLLIKVILVGHQHRTHKTTRATEKLLLRRNTETS